MAYGTAKLKTLKWLERLSKKREAYKPAIKPDRLSYVFAYFGNLYATDSLILAKVEFDDERRAGDSGWEILSKFTDENNHLLPILRYEVCSPEYFDFSYDFFDRHIPRPAEYIISSSDMPIFDAHVLRFALEPFSINNINVYMAFTPDRVVLSGHNREVSIVVVVMGKRH